MAKDFAKKFYNSKQWLITRDIYRASKFGICERCNSSNANHIHHKILLTIFNINDPEVTLNTKNLELLCHECHNKEHMSKYSPLQYGMRFDASGDIVCHPPKRL